MPNNSKKSDIFTKKGKEFTFVNAIKDKNSENNSESGSSGESGDAKNFTDGDVTTEYDRFELKLLEPGFDTKQEISEIRADRTAAILEDLKQRSLLKEDEPESPRTENVSLAAAFVYHIISGLESYLNPEIKVALISGLNENEFGFSLTERVQTDDLVALLDNMREKKQKQFLLDKLNNFEAPSAHNYQSYFIRQEEERRKMVSHNYRSMM